MKTCKTCGLEKDESEFFKKRRTSLEGSCKSCKKKKTRERIDADPEHKEKVRLRSEVRRRTEEYKEWRKGHQERNREKISAYVLDEYHRNKNRLEKQKIWKSKNKERIRKYTATARKRFPFRTAARSYVCAAIKEGIIVRPEKCSRCNKECKPEAHHEDYMRPLDVVWLCRQCHGFEHRKL